ncbi:MAG: hypothetical protein F2817_04545 [Actinobacteria bacterium]|nr:hypothetical protein [Actinomycetota bacterium]
MPQSRWEGTTGNGQGPATTGSCGPDVRAAAALTAGPAVDAPARPADLDALDGIPVGPNRPLLHIYMTPIGDRPGIGALALCGARRTAAEDVPAATGRPCRVCLQIARDEHGMDLAARLGTA